MIEETRYKKQETDNAQGPNKNEPRRIYDLEQRCLVFAKNVVLYTANLKRSVSNLEFSKQLIRSSASVGANYVEANDALGKKDFGLRIKTCRKEAKEAAYWLALIIETNTEEQVKNDGESLRSEAVQLKKIFSAILNKVL